MKASYLSSYRWLFALRQFLWYWGFVSFGVGWSLLAAGPAYEVEIDGRSGHTVELQGGGAHRIELQMDALVTIRPRELSCDEFRFFSDGASVSGSFRFSASAIPLRGAPARPYSDSQRQPFNRPNSLTESAVTPDGVHLYVKTNDEVFVYDNALEVYAFEYVSERSVARVWVALPRPYSYESRFEHFDFPASHRVLETESAPSCLFGEVVAVDTDLPLSGTAVELGGQSTRSDRGGSFSLQGIRPGDPPFRLVRTGYESWNQTLTIPGFEILHYRFLMEPQAEGPDLVGRVTWADLRGKMLPGETREVVVELSNHGSGPATGFVELEVSLATAEPNGSLLPLNRFTVAIDLPPGGQRTFQLPVILQAESSGPFSKAGERRLRLSIDVAPELGETDSGNNVAFSSTFWMGEFVYVITHGFKPNPFGDWISFRGASHRMAQAIREMHASHPVFDQRLVNYVTEWESSEGFFEAFAFLFVAKVADAIATVAGSELDLPKAAAARLVSAGLKDLAKRRVAVSSARAIEASEQIVDQLQLPRYLMRDVSLSARFQRIQMIGHSRGAAVNAMASNNLGLRKFNVGDFISLDGFSTDWPDDADLIGDISIVRDAIGARKLNFRVEDAIDDYVMNLIELEHPVHQFLLEWLIDEAQRRGGYVGAVASLYPSPAVRREIRNFDLRAPSRGGAGFEDIPIHGQRARSNHVNIQDLYQTAPQFLYNQFVGRAGLQQRSLTEIATDFVSGANHEARPLSSLVRQQNLDALSFGFRDGDFEELAHVSHTFASLEREPLGEPLVDAWVAILAKPQEQLDLSWDISGDVRFSREGNNSFVTMRFPETASLEQTVHVPWPGAYEVDFDLAVWNLRGYAVLRVLVDDQEVGSIPLVRHDGFIRQSLGVDLDSAVSRVRFQLGGTPGSVTTIGLDKLVLMPSETTLRLERQPVTGELLLFPEGVPVDELVLERSTDLVNWRLYRALEDPDWEEGVVLEESLAENAFFRTRRNGAFDR